jgi:hypothetical protein
LAAVEDFFLELAKNKTFSKKFADLNDRYNRDGTAENVASDVVSIAKENGFSFTVREFLDYISSFMGDEELSAVAGGVCIAGSHTHDMKVHDVIKIMNLINQKGL